MALSINLLFTFLTNNQIFYKMYEWFEQQLIIIFIINNFWLLLFPFLNPLVCKIYSLIWPTNKFNSHKNCHSTSQLIGL